MVWTRREFLTVTGGIGLAAGSGLRQASAAPFSDYAQSVLAKNPVAYWRLDESRGPTAFDSSAHKHHGSYRGTPLLQQPGALQGEANTALRLDGKGAYVEIPSQPGFSQPTSGNGLTVEVWLRPDALDFTGESADHYLHWL